MSDETVTIELNPREQRLYDEVRRRVARSAPGRTTGLRDVLLLLPDLSVLLVRLLRDPRVPRGPKLLALFGVGYLLSPVDLLPGFLFGPIGLVDDLLVVTAALSRLVNQVHPDVVRDAWPGPGDALEAIQRVTAWSEGLVTPRVRGFVRGLLGLQQQR